MGVETSTGGTRAERRGETTRRFDVSRVYMADGCNLDCAFCNSRQGFKPRFTLRRFERFLETTQAGELVLTGGEPTLSRLLGDALAMARERFGGVVTVETNGLLLATERAYERLTTTPPDRVVWNLLSTRPETFARITRRRLPAGLLERVAETLDRSGIPVVLSVTPVPDNVAEVPEMAAFARRLRRLEEIRILRPLGVDPDGAYYATLERGLRELIRAARGRPPLAVDTRFPLLLSSHLPVRRIRVDDAGHDASADRETPPGLEDLAGLPSIALDDAEATALTEGLRRCIRLSIPEHLLPIYRLHAEHHGWCHDALDLAADDEPTVAFYAGPEKLDIDRIKAAEREIYSARTGALPRDAHRRVGEALGYPPCCVAHYLEHVDNGLPPAAQAYRLVERALAVSGGLHPDLNLFLPRDASLISHFPCRYDCPASLEITGRLRGRLPDRALADRASTVLLSMDGSKLVFHGVQTASARRVEHIVLATGCYAALREGEIVGQGGGDLLLDFQ